MNKIYMNVTRIIRTQPTYYVSHVLYGSKFFLYYIVEATWSLSNEH